MTADPDVAFIPRLEIGVPVRNEERTLRRTLTSILEQTYPEIAIHISDNASSDDTPLICSEFAARDPRVTFTRHEQASEIPDNFRFLIDRTTAPFFAFLAGDDWWAPTFAERCLEFLAAHPETVACVTKATFVDAEARPTHPSDGTYALEGTKLARIRSYLRAPGDNSRIFGVHRTPVLQDAFRRTPTIVAYDWLICALTLASGTHAEWPETLLFREETPPRDYVKFSYRWEPSRIGRAVPNLRMTRVLLSNVPPRDRVALLPTVIWHNWRMMENSPYAASRSVAQLSAKVVTARAKVSRR